MSFVTGLRCVVCGRACRAGTCLTCPDCGPAEGILDVEYDLEAAAAELNPPALANRPRTLWRYAALLPVDGPPPEPLAELGWTPVLEAPRLAAVLGIRRLRLKDDGRSPSGSFKDRASAVGVRRALAEGAAAIACASTGNAATSLAWCAAAVGLPAYIFVPRHVPAGKLAQLLAYGACVFRVQGTYADAYELCTQACARFGWYNRNCAVNPYLVEGKKTGGLEAAEQCAADPPDWVACSVGDGCTLAGIAKGFRQMHALGLLERLPRLLGVQAAGVAPIAAAFAAPAEPATCLQEPPGQTYADSINVPVPRNWRKALRAVRDSGGAFVAVEDQQIMEAVRLTGRLAGVFAEPAAAAAVAGVAYARRQGLIPADADVLAFITGTGLKDIQGALRAVGEPHDVASDLDHVARFVQTRNPLPTSGKERNIPWPRC